MVKGNYFYIVAKMAAMFICLSITMIINTSCKQTTFECTDDIGCVTVKPGEPVKLGIIQDLSGGASVFGKTQLNSIILALEHRNNQVLGHPIELQIEDEECSEAGGKNSAYKIISDPQVVAVLGTTCSGAAAVASKIISQAGLVLMSGVNSAPSLTAIDQVKGENWQPGFFRTASNDALRSKAAARFAYYELGIKFAATIDDGDAYTLGAAEIFSQEFVKLGGTIVLSATIDKGDLDMKPVLTSVANSQAQFLFFHLFANEGVRIIRQVKKMPELGDLKMLGGSPLLVPEVIKRMGADGIGIYFSSSTQPEGTGYEELIAAYEAKYKEKPAGSGSSTAYDAVNILLNAIEEVAVQDKDNTLHIGRQALRDALYATKDYDGTTGILSCNEFGDCGLTKVNIVELYSSSGSEEDIQQRVVYIYEPR